MKWDLLRFGIKDNAGRFVKSELDAIALRLMVELRAAQILRPRFDRGAINDYLWHGKMKLAFWYHRKASEFVFHTPLQLLLTGLLGDGTLDRGAHVGRALCNHNPRGL
ncbi:MAG: hypothetical protein JWN70_6614 [Planctomycetaceae bacterium]|nr:hypothetical protein [Planctomycetaceae bacterium]